MSAAVSASAASTAVVSSSASAAVNYEERRISTWKTNPADSQGATRRVKVVEGSDGNQDLVGRIFDILRSDHDGGKLVLKVPKK